MQEVLSFIEKNTELNQNDFVVVALSGGPDSMLLLNLVMNLRKKDNFNIVCAHVHHNLRQESDNEAIFVKKYCEDNNLIFEMKKLNYEEKFTESIGHNMRYEYFDEVVKKYGAKYLFTAHHGDDLVESILMKIVRGASVLGYSGFENIVFKENYTILRPLITITKKDILDYLHNNNIPYVIDSSNEDDTYTRNRYRKYILPKLKYEDVNVHLKFLQFSNQLKEYNNYFEKKANDYYLDIVNSDSIVISKIKLLDKIIAKKIIYKFLRKFYDNSDDINKKHIDSIYSIIMSDKPNIIIDVPRYKIIKEYDNLRICKSLDDDIYEFILNNEVSLPNGKKIIKVNSSDLTDNNVTFLKSSDIKLPLHIRNYKTGDKMSIKNMTGHKKIKDIFINEKINYTQRKIYPVVTDSKGEIIWLPGIKKSSFDNKKDEKYDIILEYR